MYYISPIHSATIVTEGNGNTPDLVSPVSPVKSLPYSTMCKFWGNLGNWCPPSKSRSLCYLVLSYAVPCNPPPCKHSFMSKFYIFFSKYIYFGCPGSSLQHRLISSPQIPYILEWHSNMSPYTSSLTSQCLYRELSKSLPVSTRPLLMTRERMSLCGLLHCWDPVTQKVRLSYLTRKSQKENLFIKLELDLIWNLLWYFLRQSIKKLVVGGGSSCSHFFLLGYWKSPISFTVVTGLLTFLPQLPKEKPGIAGIIWH